MDERNDFPGDDTPASATENTRENESHGTSKFFGTTKDVVDRYTHCTLCGANLHFNHITDFSRNMTQETAKCPECGVKVRQILHRLQ